VLCSRSLVLCLFLFTRLPAGEEGKVQEAMAVMSEVDRLKQQKAAIQASAVLAVSPAARTTRGLYGTGGGVGGGGGGG